MSHGYGADCNDLISIGEYWQRFLPDIAFVAPNAPTVCQINKSGFEWFDLMQTSATKINEEFKSALVKLNNFVEAQLLEYKLSKQDLFLMGFSQGTMMSLQLGLSYKESVGGILGYSGKIYDFEMLKKILTLNHPLFCFTEQKIPLFL